MKNGGASSRLRAFVVEDELPTRNYLVELLQGSGLADVVGAVGGLDDARQALQGASHEIDAAFVDVQLVHGDQGGLALVRSLAGTSSAPLFVLATAFKEHAIEAFNLGVADYLLKPFTEERVEQCLQRLLDRRPAPAPANPSRIVARRGRTLVFLEPDEVWAFEASERMASVHSLHGIFDLDLSLSAIELSLGRAFTRVHRNWLVNSAFIKELGREGNETRVFVGSGLGPDQRGLHVPVARERAQSLREMLLATATGLRRG
ncbi:MAG TPA: LytTR family DNA-binding domain-containing protein [Polyangiaceae bacterium]|jgi:DNA-binding LytR/AlgR family response regulator|nr:LytTR family DNA-binding domain-containing protein [Polyangiaceae bacterium]